MSGKRCEPCRGTGLTHCSDPEHCGGPWDCDAEIIRLRTEVERLSGQFKLNGDQTVAVATDEYWIPTGPYTPRGVKIQLLGQGGVATYSEYHGDPFFTHWHPLPKRRD